LIDHGELELLTFIRVRSETCCNVEIKSTLEDRSVGDRFDILESEEDERFFEPEEYTA
jgi:hypothetical protein